MPFSPVVSSTVLQLPNALLVMRVPSRPCNALQSDIHDNDDIHIVQFGLHISHSLSSALSEEVASAWASVLHRFSHFFPNHPPRSSPHDPASTTTYTRLPEEYDVGDLRCLLQPPSLLRPGAPGALRPTPPTSASMSSLGRAGRSSDVDNAPTATDDRGGGGDGPRVQSAPRRMR